MKMAFSKSLAAQLILLLICASVAAAQTNSRIEFKSGKSSAVARRDLTSETTHTYSLRVKKGQRITAKVASGNGKVEIDATNLSAGHFEDGNVKSLNLRADDSGDYQIYVRNMGKTATKFTLTVAVR